MNISTQNILERKAKYDPMISVFKPTIKRKDMDSVLTCMVSEIIGAGPVYNQFIERVSEYFSNSGAVAFSSYYFALSGALDAMDLRSGDEVMLSILSPNIYSKILKDKGIIPLYCDVEEDSGSILGSDIEKYKSRNPKAILLHYTLGFIPDIEAIMQHNIPIIEDISHCTGAKKLETLLGNFGDIAVLSLDADNIFTTANGGLVFSKEKRIVKNLKTIMDAAGTDFILSDFNASLGLTQIKEIEHWIVRRREIYAIYISACMKSHNKTLTQKHDEFSPFFSFPVLLSSSMNEVRKYARKHDVDTLPAYLDSILSKNVSLEEQFPNAKRLLLSCLLFPLYPMLSNKNIELVSKVLSTLP